MTDIEKASTFLQGAASRSSELATKYVDPRSYVEHSPGVPDGVGGLKEYVDQLPRADLQLEVLRAFQDGAFVVTQAQGSIPGREVLFDVFRFENGLIVEHWGFSSKAGPPNKSGHTQADGPTEPTHDEDTEKNKSLVREYYETVHIGGDHGRITRYTAGDYMVRHEPGVADGVAAFMRDLAVITRSRSIDEIRFVLGQGDFVFVAAKGSVERRPCVYIDLYRVDADKLVEHWGFPEDVPPRGEWRNTNGML